MGVALPIIIIGGGIGGLAAAACFRKRGVGALVYERAAELKEVGAALGVWPNATRVLARLGVYEALAKRANVAVTGALRDKDGRAMKEIKLPASDIAGVAAQRADLHGVLLSAVEAGRIFLGKECVAIERDEAGGRVRAGFGDGSFSEWGSGLVGADGIRSAVRRLTLNDGEPIYRGYVAWRGVAAFDSGKYLGETWGRGQRFGLIPLGRGRTAWWATANKRESEACRGTQAEWKREVLARYRGYHAPIGELIEATPVEGFLCTAIADRAGPSAKRPWGTGRVTLLGDAAHPTTPNLGQGACMAIEDAAVLSHAVAALPEVGTALRVYEASRYERTALIVRESLKFGAVGQWENGLACWLRNKLMRFSPEGKLRRQFHDLWGYDAWEAGLVMPGW